MLCFVFCFSSCFDFCTLFSFCFCVRQSRMIFLILLRPCFGVIFVSWFIIPIICPFLSVTWYARVALLCVVVGLRVARFPRWGFCFSYVRVGSLFCFSFCLCSALRAALRSVSVVMESYFCAVILSFFFLYFSSAWLSGVVLCVILYWVRSASCRCLLSLSTLFALRRCR